jgi:hypothetical protein
LEAATVSNVLNYQDDFPLVNIDKRNKKIFPVLSAVYTAKPVLQQTTVQILIDSFLNYRTQRSITIFIPLFVFPAKFIKMLFDKLEKWGCPRIAWSINSGCQAFL